MSDADLKNPAPSGAASEAESDCAKDESALESHYEESQNKQGENFEGDSPLYRKLLWLTASRLILVTTLLVLFSKLIFQEIPDALGSMERFLFVIALICYSASLAYLLVLRKTKRVSPSFALIQVVVDALLANLAVYLTGGPSSIFVFLLPLSVISASTMLGRRGAILTSVFSCAVFACLTMGLFFHWIPVPFLAPPLGDLKKTVGLLVLDLSAIFLTGVLAGFLSEQIRRTSEALKSSKAAYLKLEQLHECIVRSVSSGLLSLDSDCRIFSANPAAERILGLSTGDLKGRDARQFFPQLNPESVQNSESVEEAEVKLPDGRNRWISASISPLILPGSGGNSGFVVAFNDMTERHMMAEAVQRAERLAAVGKLSAGLAHELRNPLASMSGSIQLLSESASLAEDDRMLMNIVLRETDRLDNLVGDFLRFARPRPLSKSRFDLAASIRTAASLWKNEPKFRSTEIGLDLPEELWVTGDHDQLDQVIWNLVVNARDALRPSGGRIQIALRLNDDDSAFLSVTDNGCGIPEKDLPSLFDPFFTTKKGGTGLGLAIAEGIIRSHDGRIWAEAAPSGQGSVFNVVFPRGEGDGQSSPEKAQQAAVPAPSAD